MTLSQEQMTHRAPGTGRSHQRASAIEVGLLFLLLLVTSISFALGQPSPDTFNLRDGDPVRLNGTANIIWTDPPQGSGLSPGHWITLLDEDGLPWRLSMTEEQKEAAGGLMNLGGARVVVEGWVVPSSRLVVRVDRIVHLDSPVGQAVGEREFFGSQPYVWILLRFADVPDTPHPPAWFEEQALGEEPSMDHYWHEVSFGTIDMQGSVVAGNQWFDLPHEHDYYVYDFNNDFPGKDIDDERTIPDAIELADPYVDFREFSGFLLCFNDTLNCCAIGGRKELTIDGETRVWGICHLPNWGWGNHEKITHEMGHSFGFPHSSGPYGEVYDSRWDVMSHGCGLCTDQHPEYGWMGVNTIAFNKELAGWIHPLHQYIMSDGPTVTSLWLNDLAVVPPGGRYLMARINEPSPTYYHLIERRRWTGYDVNIPDETVVLHKVDINRGNPAWVVDPDGNGDCNDEGARWDLGETYWAGNVVMTVTDVDDSGSQITMTNVARQDVYVDKNNSGYEDGSINFPWDTVHEGYGAVQPEGSVYITPETYPGEVTLRKPATLYPSTDVGVVIIGP